MGFQDNLVMCYVRKLYGSLTLEHFFDVKIVRAILNQTSIDYTYFGIRILDGNINLHVVPTSPIML